MCATLAVAGRAACPRPDRELEPASLGAFLHAHPGAMLVDVREAYEHLASGAPSWRAGGAHNVPMSRLANRLPAWLAGSPRALVFFCRSGARSARAARYLHRLGYDDAWHVTGSLPIAL